MNIFEIAHLVRAKRREKGWTQGELARRADVSRQLVSDFENGNLDEIGFMKIGRMCLQLKLEINVEPVKMDVPAGEAAARRVAELERSDRLVAGAMAPRGEPGCE